MRSASGAVSVSAVPRRRIGVRALGTYTSAIRAPFYRELLYTVTQFSANVQWKPKAYTRSLRFPRPVSLSRLSRLSVDSSKPSSRRSLCIVTLPADGAKPLVATHLADPHAFGAAANVTTRLEHQCNLGFAANDAQDSGFRLHSWWGRRRRRRRRCRRRRRRRRIRWHCCCLRRRWGTICRSRSSSCG